MLKVKQLSSALIKTEVPCGFRFGNHVWNLNSFKYLLNPVSYRSVKKPLSRNGGEVLMVLKNKVYKERKYLHSTGKIQTSFQGCWSFENKTCIPESWFVFFLHLNCFNKVLYLFANTVTLLLFFFLKHFIAYVWLINSMYKRESKNN